MSRVGAGSLETYSLAHSLRVELPLGLNGSVDKSESAGSATTELGLHAEDGDSIFLGLQLLGKGCLDASFRDVARVWVQDLDGLYKERLTSNILSARLLRLIHQPFFILTHCFLSRSGFYFILLK